MPTPTTPTMTLQEFARTRRYVTDLSDELGEGWEDETEEAPAGFVYKSNLYIEAVLPHWPAETRARGGWCLTLGNEQYVTNDLSGLEERLYRYALDEGRIAAPEDPADTAETVKLLDQRLDERDAELKQLRTALATMGEGYEAKKAELKTLKAGYDRMRRETMDMARVLGDLLDRVDNPSWHGTTQRGRQLLTKHQEAARG